MTPEEKTYLEHLRTIERIAAFVARKNHVSPDETAEFVQEVRVQLLDDDYAIIRKFEGRSSFSTYLTTVIGRLFHQWRIAQWGKWRPSAESKRLGDKAITLERLLTRDGYTFEEAVKVLTTPAGANYTPAELESIYLHLPLRHPRPMMISDENLPDAIAVDGDAEDRAAKGDRERAARRAAAAMNDLLASMNDEDRLILQMRFWHSMKVSVIAGRLHIDQRKLYKRLEKLFGALRRGLEGAGVSRSDIETLLDRGDHNVRFATFDDPEIPPAGPSHLPGGKGGGGGEKVLQ